MEQTKPRLREDTVWYLEDASDLVKSVVAYPRPKKNDRREDRSGFFVSSYGGYGRYLRRTLIGVVPPGKPFGRPEVDQVIRYHIQTKHHFNRYARSLGFLDWASQPDPFRRFSGAPLTVLPLLKPDEEPLSPSYDAIYERGAVPSQPVTICTLSRFFEYALALSAWKKAGESEWALRSNPSSGNLHPTEGYLVLPQIEGLDLKPGLYHYAQKEHGLELRAEFSSEEVRLKSSISALPGAHF